MAQSVSPQELLRQLQIIGAVVGNRRLPTTVPTAAALQTQTSQPNTVRRSSHKKSSCDLRRSDSDMTVERFVYKMSTSR